MVRVLCTRKQIKRRDKMRWYYTIYIYIHDRDEGLGSGAWRVAKEDMKLCVAVACLKLMIIFNGTSLGISR